MNISKILSSKNPIISFEFFPPKTEEGLKTLLKTINELTVINPQYISITYGAGGTTKEKTNNLSIQLQKTNHIPVIAHLTCVDATKTEILTFLDDLNNKGITNIMALKGDRPKNQSPDTNAINDFPHAIDLVKLIKTHYPQMGIGVAGFPEGHPDSPNRLTELTYLKEKVDAGANYICTQLFFDNRDYYDFCERCHLAGITIPIIPGIMPIRTHQGMERIAQLAPRTRFPANLLTQLQSAKTDSEIEQIGTNWTINQVKDLLQHNVKGIHFYTLNQASPFIEIWNQIKDK